MQAKIKSQKVQRVLLLVACFCVLAPLAASAAPLDGLAETFARSGATWGPALLVIGGLLTGGAILMGHHQAGEKVRNFILGAIFLVLAAGGGAFMLGKLQELVR